MSAKQSPDAKTAQAVKGFLALLGDYRPVGARLFGSRARGDHAPDSDADVAVLLEGKAGSLLATKLAMPDIAYDVLLETGINISPLPVWMDEWEHPELFSNPALLRNIAAEGVAV